MTSPLMNYFSCVNMCISLNCFCVTFVVLGNLLMLNLSVMNSSKAMYNILCKKKHPKHTGKESYFLYVGLDKEGKSGLHAVQ